MIYLFAGDDTGSKRKSFELFLASISDQNNILQVNKNDFDPLQFQSLINTSGLFFAKSTVVLINMFEREEAKDFLLSRLGEISLSSNDFVFLETALTKPDLDLFKKVRSEVNYFELSKAQKEKFNNFLLANSFGAKDKFGLWFNYRQAVDLGVGLEELVGVLFWKAKDMIIRGDFRQFSKEYLQDFISKLAYLLPEARKKNHDDEIAFEKFLLEAF